MGNTNTNPRNRSASNPWIKVKGSKKPGENSNSSSRGSIVTINNLVVDPLANTKTELKENRSSQNLPALQEQLSLERKKDARSLSPTQFRKFFEQNFPLPAESNRKPSNPAAQTTINPKQGGQHQIRPVNHLVTRIGMNTQPDFHLRGPIPLKPKTHPIYDDYIITKQVLGLGISGKVISCTHKQTKIKYALKTLRDSLKARREIDLQWRACQGCQHIVQIIDVYENVINNQKVFLIVMECMEGGELFAKISERTTPFTEQEVAKIMHQICAAVKHLHTMRIVHRDLKPENLLLSTNDETAIIKLTDFGFAKEVSLGLATPCYTPYYVAPEVLGSERYDISCDIWSLGVIMYILCCGYPPFYSTHGQPISPGMKRRIRAGEYAFPEAEWSRVSQEAKDLIAGMLETIPEKRSTIEDVVRSNWISRYYNVPQTPLPSVEILKEDRDNWKEVQQNMGMALDEMRINWDAKPLIRLDPSKNKLFEKRTQKKKPDTEITMIESTSKKTATSPGSEASGAAASSMVVEDLSREASTVTMRGQTPTNSRPSSPKMF